MKKYTLVIIAASTVLLFLANTVYGAGPSYMFTIPDDNHQLVRVKATFTLVQDEIFMVDWGAEHLPNHWATFIQNMKLKDATGSEIPFEAIKPDRWKVNGPLGQSVTLTYEIVLKHADYQWPVKDREAAYARDWGVFYVGRGLFILPSAKLPEAELNFNLPKGWHISTPWKKREGKANSFVAANARDLVQAAIFAGTHSEVSIKEGTTEITFALGGDQIIAARPLFEEVTRAVLKAYSEMFGGVSPDNRMLIIINPEYKYEGGGGVFNRSISMTFSEPPSKQNISLWGHTLSHEIFHLWNGIAISPQTPEEEWFKEGFTDYYSVLTMVRLGHFDERTMFFKTGLKYEVYLDYPGRLSLRKAGDEKAKNSGYIYGGGWAMALALDLEIRQRTKNQKSLDNVMQDLYREFGNSGKGYTATSLIETIRRVTGFDSSELFSKYVSGLERLPLGDYLNPVGLMLAETQGLSTHGRLVIKRKPNLTEAETAFLQKYLGR
jgi:predicted metalloprotease with PDZ domain